MHTPSRCQTTVFVTKQTGKTGKTNFAAIDITEAGVRDTSELKLDKPDISEKSEIKIVETDWMQISAACVKNNKP